MTKKYYLLQSNKKMHHVWNAMWNVMILKQNSLKDDITTI